MWWCPIGVSFKSVPHGEGPLQSMMIWAIETTPRSMDRITSQGNLHMYICWVEVMQEGHLVPSYSCGS
jgi:hypothetical protein